ncbi:MAG: hypothetical protein ACXABY_21150 [Candidatus Thorarchaeota archaeon]|jgi:hypothetical protein
MDRNVGIPEYCSRDTFNLDQYKIIWRENRWSCIKWQNKDLEICHSCPKYDDENIGTIVIAELLKNYSWDHCPDCREEIPDKVLTIYNNLEWIFKFI